MFKQIRVIATYTFIVAVVICIFTSVIAIWDFVESSVLTKAFTSLFVLLVSYILIIFATLERDGWFLDSIVGNDEQKTTTSPLSWGKVLLAIVSLWLLWVAFNALVF